MCDNCKIKGGITCDVIIIASSFGTYCSGCLCLPEFKDLSLKIDTELKEQWAKALEFDKANGSGYWRMQHGR